MSTENSHTTFNFDSFLQNKLDELKQNGRYRHFLKINKNAQTFPEFILENEGNAKQIVNWCSNDYLAMSTNERIIENAKSVLDIAGLGSGGTRNISGSTIYHAQLEECLSDWHQKEKTVLFNSAYQANLTSLATIGRHIPDLLFISDEENHASLIEGMRNSKNKKYIFKHNDICDLESIFQQLPPHLPKIVVLESVYSISGTVAPLKEIVNLSKKYNALIYLDEVHAVGLYGNTGAGIAEQLKITHEIDFINGTLSKAIGCFGGYICTSHSWADFIRSFASGYIFTTSIPPSLCAAAVQSILEIKSNESVRAQFFRNLHLLRKYLTKAEIKFNGEESHITNITIGNAIKCKQIADFLLNHGGVYVQPINYPTVRIGQECLRITITPRHTLKHIVSLVHHLKALALDEIKLVGRSSPLSKVQMEITAQKIKTVFPWIVIKEIYTETKGDILKDIPLHTEEGTDFFTNAIVEFLNTNKADIAVHSLKDMSTDHFFGPHSFAVIDRAEVRDLAIFNDYSLEKLKKGIPLKIGTCSFRRETLVLEFLKKGLPYFGSEINIEAVPIRGNIDTRLRKLSTEDFDGIILAFAGIERMLSHPRYKTQFEALLKDKKIMVLPLIECTPAPCQGALVAESNLQNSNATFIIEKINDKKLFQECTNEKRVASLYGAGCIQKFGVTSVTIEKETFTYANGIDQNNQEIDAWHGFHPIEKVNPESILYSDQLGFVPTRNKIALKAFPLRTDLFISHLNSIESMDISSLYKHRVWTAGTASWKKLAAKGIWVTGCADSLGFKSLLPIFSTSLIQSDKEHITILTNQTSAERWAAKGYHALATYGISYSLDLLDKYQIKKAELIFWNCFAHFEQVKSVLQNSLLHACLSGDTAYELKKQGIDPIIFPTLNAFYQWKKKYSLAYYAA